MGLPQLNDDATLYPDCCLSISTGLIHLVTSIINGNTPVDQPRRVLSVGSGTGLLEAYLHSHWSEDPDSNLTIEGVEVLTAHHANPVNKYLPEENCSTVRGTWELSSHLNTAAVLMFVYPREPDLIKKYLQATQEDESASLKAAVWLGPKVDWETFQQSFEGIPGFSKPEVIQGYGMADFEMMAVIRRNT